MTSPCWNKLLPKIVHLRHHVETHCCLKYCSLNMSPYIMSEIIPVKIRHNYWGAAVAQRLAVRFFFFYYLGFTARKDYFTHFELSQSLGGAKTGDPREKPLDRPQAELGLSHMWPELGWNPQQWDDERFRALKISILNHMATGEGGGGLSELALQSKGRWFNTPLLLNDGTGWLVLAQNCTFLSVLDWDSSFTRYPSCYEEGGHSLL